MGPLFDYGILQCISKEEFFLGTPDPGLPPGWLPKPADDLFSLPFSKSVSGTKRESLPLHSPCPWENLFLTHSQGGQAGRVL